MFDVDPTRPTDEILADLKQAVVDGAANKLLAASALAPMGALLVRLSRDADRTAKKLLIATYVLLAVTVLLAGIEVLKLAPEWTHRSDAQIHLGD